MDALNARYPIEPKVFFPWEQRRGLLGAFGRRRARVLIAGALLVLGVIAVYASGERAAAVRATRATLTNVQRALFAYRADHGFGCPRALGDLVAQGYLRGDPADAWGNPLRMTCPGRRDPLGFDLASDGPDGLVGGLDEVR